MTVIGTSRPSQQPTLPGPAGHLFTHDRVRSIRNGFTLIELLTVIGIIAILATLTLSVLSSAKKFSHQARCTSNLHQLGIAMNIYLDDHADRPLFLDTLVMENYAPDPGVLLCPSDKLGNWGNLVNYQPVSQTTFTSSPASIAERNATKPITQGPLAFSYLHPLQWGDKAWNRILKSSTGSGWITCQLHGIGKQNEEFPSIQDFQGLILRGTLEGSVLRRQTYRTDLVTTDSSMKTDGFAPNEALAPPSRANDDSFDSSSNAFPWDLFIDETVE